MSQDAFSCPFCAQIVPIKPTAPSFDPNEGLKQSIVEHNKQMHNPYDSINNR